MLVQESTHIHGTRRIVEQAVDEWPVHRALVDLLQPRYGPLLDAALPLLRDVRTGVRVTREVIDHDIVSEHLAVMQASADRHLFDGLQRQRVDLMHLVSFHELLESIQFPLLLFHLLKGQGTIWLSKKENSEFVYSLSHFSPNDAFYIVRKGTDPHRHLQK